MKQPILKVLLVFGLLAFVACSDKQNSNRTYEDFKNYVIDRTDQAEKYFDKEWSELEAEYNEKRIKAEEKIDEWSDETRSEFASLKSDWEEFKERYEAEHMRRNAVPELTVLEGALLPSGIKGNMQNVNAANIVDVHAHFVNYVEAHKDALSQEQWKYVEGIWEALNTRKNEVEKDITTDDNIKIAEWKVKYGTIKAINRPTAEAGGSSTEKSK
jgi:hypothetical protein